MNININVSVAELVDKITILEIKSEKINDIKKLENIKNELALLNKSFKQIETEKLLILKDKLKQINLKLWKIEDDIRKCEKNKIFDDSFIQLARDVYITNDKRFNVKNSINELFSSKIKEVKSYEDY